MTAAQHTIHPDLVSLVQSGVIPPESTAFRPAFQSLHDTTAAKYFDVAQFPRDLLVTEDFVRTVLKPSGVPGDSFVADSYQRSVQWVLSIPDNFGNVQNLIILTPYEANDLTDKIRAFAKVTLHLFSPRSNSSFAPLDRLELYNVGRSFAGGSVSQSLTAQLNLFSGTLYMRSFEEYEMLCDFLGILKTTAKPGQEVLADNFITPPDGKWKFTESPVLFLRVHVMRIRNEGAGIEKTHIGKMLGGLRLEESDFVEEV